MDTRKTKAFLLRKIMLSNDDALCDFFTREYGKVTLVVRKFGASQKRKRVVDFFQLLDLEWKESQVGKKAFTSAEIGKVWIGIQSDLSLMEEGYACLSLLTNFCETSEGESQNIFFDFCASFFDQMKDLSETYRKLFFTLRLLIYLGAWPKLDSIRGDIYYDDKLHLSSVPFEGSYSIDNVTRQVLEFLRRADMGVYIQKQNNLPAQNREEAALFLERVFALYK